MGKRKPKPVQHKLSGSKFLFLLRKNQSPLFPPLSFTFPLTDKSVFDEKKSIKTSAVPVFRLIFKFRSACILHE